MAAWATCIEHTTRVSAATSRSRCCRRPSAPIPDRLRRFEQEARAAAALNHPNILTVHEVGAYRADFGAPAAPYVVSELLEGQTLRETISGGPLPVRRVVDYATQIASGLAAAHDKGVVHRDLKPENLFLTRDGRIKILDFGLAKLRDPEPVDAGGATMRRGTWKPVSALSSARPGTCRRSRCARSPVDHRTDIFSFGAVLYEMISGTRAFRGDTAADTISAILKSDPPELTGLQGAVPPTLERIVDHCLEKTPELRFQAARDIVFNLEALSTSPATSGPIAPAPPQRRRLGVIAAAAAAVALAAAAGAASWWLATLAHESASFRQVTFRHGTLGAARFTGDGQNIVYTAAWEGLLPEVFVVPANQTGGRSLELKNAALLAVARTGEIAVALAPRPLVGAGFFAPGTLARVSMTGGAPKAEIENILAADYTPDGSSMAIVRVLPDPRSCLVEFPVGTVLFRAPYVSDLRFSPDGQHLALIAHPNPTDDRGTVVILRRDGGQVATGPMRDSHRGLAWSPGGDEVWTTAPLMNGIVEALDLSGRRRDLINVPGRLQIRDVRPNGHLLMDQGTAHRGMIVVSNNGEMQRDVTWLNYSVVRDISRDGQMVLFEEQGINYRTFVRNVDGSPAVEIGSGYGVALSNDKAWALSLRFPVSGAELWLEPVGPGQARRLSPPGIVPFNVGQFLADGKRIVFPGREGDRPPRTYVQVLDGSAPKAVTQEGFVGTLLSPDERWVAANGPAGPVLVPFEGGPPTPIRGIQPGDSMRRWTNDGQIFVAAATPTRLRIDRLNPWTGERTLWRQTSAPAFTGMRISMPFITPDGNAYTYGYNVSSSDLYVVSGVR